jgi:hypothetical protein
MKLRMGTYYTFLSDGECYSFPVATALKSLRRYDRENLESLAELESATGKHMSLSSTALL